MHQAGFLAAAALYGLEHHFDALAEDHRRAARLAELVAQVEGVHVEPPETNIVMLDLEVADPEVVLALLRKAGVWMTRFGPRRLRAVLHRDIDDAGVERAAGALRIALSE